jgi:hypothetical protein
MAYIPEQGDLVWLDFDPSSGKEIMKRQPMRNFLFNRGQVDHNGIWLSFSTQIYRQNQIIL